MTTPSSVGGAGGSASYRSSEREPASSEPDKSGIRPQAPGDQTQDGQTTLLICDDHPAYAKGLAILLENEATDFTVVGTATSAQEALQKTKQFSPDIVLMDIRMPGVDGIGATKQIRVEVPQAKVIMVTVSDEPGDLYQALKAGASGFVTKDKEVSEIAEAIRSVMRGHMVIPVELAARFLNDLSEAEATLSSQEHHILTGFVQGHTNKQIAASLKLSERTLNRRVEELYAKLKVHDRTQAVIWATERGIANSHTHTPHTETERKSRSELLRELRSRPSPLSHTPWATGLDPEGGAT